MDVLRRASLLACAGAALALSACGSGASSSHDESAVRQVVTTFANAHDASACSLLTDDALRNVYGGFTDPPEKARRNCVARSKAFRPAAVKITQVNFTDSQTAKVGALRSDGKVSYTVTLRKGDRGHWRINQITQGKPK